MLGRAAAPAPAGGAGRGAGGAGGAGEVSVLPWRVYVLLAVSAALFLGGTLGYWLIEPRYSLFDAFYMTVITLTTVGYGEVHELSTAGRCFTIVLLLGGVFTLFFAAS